MDLFSCLSPFVFCSLASGSSGNCYFVGTAESGILVDAGISAAQIVKRLSKVSYAIGQVKAVLVTHDHIDHVKGLETLAGKYHLPIFAHEDCIEGIKKCPATRKVDAACMNIIAPYSIFSIEGIQITPFDVSHDGNGTMGYYLSYEDHSLTIATDVGVLDAVVKDYLCKADSMVIESNYDEEMLRNGSYPYLLKKRIMSVTGHLSNLETAQFLAKHYRPEMKNIMLCHLSQNNNDPAVAMQCLNKQLRYGRVRPNASTSIFPLPRDKQTDLIYL